MLEFEFNEVRATQAAGVLLCFNGGTSWFPYILDLLYLADRKSLVDVGRPIAGANFRVTFRSIVADDLFGDLQYGRDGFWSDHIGLELNKLVLKSDPGDGELSYYEVANLERYANMHAPRAASQNALSELIRSLPEWHFPRDVKGDPLPIEDILRGALGYA